MSKEAKRVITNHSFVGRSDFGRLIPSECKLVAIAPQTEIFLFPPLGGLVKVDHPMLLREKALRQAAKLTNSKKRTTRLYLVFNQELI